MTPGGTGEDGVALGGVDAVTSHVLISDLGDVIHHGLQEG